MNAFEILINDHRAVEKLFEKIGNSGKSALKTRERLFEKLREELELHTQVEERIFYPEIQKLPGAKELVPDALEEHAEVKQMLRQIAKLSPDQHEWSDRIEELKQAVQHHVKDEEHEMFPAAREEMDEQRAEDLGRRIRQMKKQKASA
jgi:iron-sulfur cluster repair protein YtfE (RIC family)